MFTYYKKSFVTFLFFIIIIRSLRLCPSRYNTFFKKKGKWKTVTNRELLNTKDNRMYS